MRAKIEHKNDATHKEWCRNATGLLQPAPDAAVGWQWIERSCRCTRFVPAKGPIGVRSQGHTSTAWRHTCPAAILDGCCQRVWVWQGAVGYPRCIPTQPARDILGCVWGEATAGIIALAARLAGCCSQAKLRVRSRLDPKTVGAWHRKKADTAGAVGGPVGNGTR
jgi:hypothetical protein